MHKNAHNKVLDKHKETREHKGKNVFLTPAQVAAYANRMAK